jgi:hypothetical protein
MDSNNLGLSYAPDQFPGALAAFFIAGAVADFNRYIGL